MVTFMTAQIIAVLALLLTALSLNVSRIRLKYGVSYGDGGHKDLTISIRAHGNALEQCLLFAVLLLALDHHTGGLAAHLAWLGPAFVVTRVVHAAAMLKRWLRVRQMAHVLSLLAQLTTILALLR